MSSSNNQTGGLSGRVGGEDGGGASGTGEGRSGKGKEKVTEKDLDRDAQVEHDTQLSTALQLAEDEQRECAGDLSEELRQTMLAQSRSQVQMAEERRLGAERLLIAMATTVKAGNVQELERLQAIVISEGLAGSGEKSDAGYVPKASTIEEGSKSGSGSEDEDEDEDKDMGGEADNGGADDNTMDVDRASDTPVAEPSRKTKSGKARPNRNKTPARFKDEDPTFWKSRSNSNKCETCHQRGWQYFSPAQGSRRTLVNFDDTEPIRHRHNHLLRGQPGFSDMATGPLTRGTTQADQLGYIAQRLEELWVAICQIQMSIGLDPLRGDKFSEGVDAGAEVMEDVEEEDEGNNGDDDDNDSDDDDDAVGHPSKRCKINNLEGSDKEGDGGEARSKLIASPSGRASPARGGSSRDGSGSGLERSFTPWVPSGAWCETLRSLPDGPRAPRALAEEVSGVGRKRRGAQQRFKFLLALGRMLGPVGEEVAALVNKEFQWVKDEPKESEILRAEEMSGSGPEASGTGMSRPSGGGDGSESGQVETWDAVREAAVAQQLFPEGEDPKGEVDMDIDQDVPMPNVNAPNEGSGGGKLGSSEVGIKNSCQWKHGIKKDGDAVATMESFMHTRRNLREGINDPAKVVDYQLEGWPRNATDVLALCDEEVTLWTEL
ncbi:hypothetical protein B0H16DRAFT_1485216 [Mycena metata]|uniref:Uncharacterized protein n=1 Tax=Mycena metata TaxID=1033252 RepID=A0AAD7DN84_9AGAR|nr:hypothetical protein B0H16DRAFT_1485216 [Mycena metata]